MRLNTPLATLLAGSALGVGLLIASMTATAGLLGLSGPGQARLTGPYRDHRATGRARAGGAGYTFAIPRVHQAGLRASIVHRTAAACQPPAPGDGNGGGGDGGGHHHGGGHGGG
jgi:hypothetical protein